MSTEDPDRTLKKPSAGRSHTRRPLKGDVLIQAATHPALSARAVDASAGGISVEMEHEVRPGDRLVFALERGSERRRRVAEVKNTRFVSERNVFRVGLAWVVGDTRSSSSRWRRFWRRPALAND